MTSKNIWLLWAWAVAAAMVSSTALGADIKPLKEITGKGVGGKPIDKITDQDIKMCPSYPWTKWHLLKGEKKDFGNWLSIYQKECSYHDLWDPVRSPEDFKAFERMGVDVITAHIDGGGGGYNPRPLYVKDQDDASLMYSQWVLQTGRGLIPAMQTPAANGPDGQVLYTPTYDAKRGAAGWCTRCYTSPRTVEEFIARLKGNMNALGELSTWNGKPLVMFLKEESKWNYVSVRDDGSVSWGCYCQYCIEGYRKFLEKQFGTIERLNEKARAKYTSFDQVFPPPFEMRYQEPVLFHNWIQYRERARLAAVDQLVQRCGAINVQCDSTFQFGMWDVGVDSGYNPYLGAVKSDIVNVDIADGSLFCPSIGVACTVDTVLRKHPEKRALMLWGGYPTEEGIHPTAFFRRFAEYFGHVTNVRGSMWLWWDDPTELHGFDAYPTYHERMRYYPEMADAYAWWAAFGEIQSDLIAGMRTAKPGIASYWARTQTIFDPTYPPHIKKSWIFTERSKFWNWNFLGFWQSQYPVHCLFPEQVEAGEAGEYKVLYTLYGPRNTELALEKIKAFHNVGGYVYGSYDALMRNVRDQRLDVFKSVFSCEPAPGGVAAKPIYNEPGEFKTPKGYYEIVKAHPALPPVGTRIPFMSGIQVVKPLAGAEVYATYEGKPCIVGATKSLYVGTDIAVDLAMLIPPDMRPAIDEIGQITAAGGDENDYRNALKVLTGFADCAGVKRPVTVTKDGQPVFNLIVGLQEKPGARLITLTENRGTAGSYELAVDVGADQEVWDLTKNKPLKKESSEKYRLKLEGYDWRLILIADAKTVAVAATKQKEVERLGKSMPYRLSRFFFVGSEDHGRDPVNNHYLHKAEDKYLPAAVIVVPDKTTPAIESKVKEIQELVRKMSRKEITFHGVASTATDMGATLPIIPSSKLNPETAKGKNVLLVGSGGTNPSVAKWVTDEKALKEVEANRITTVQNYPWRSGGNVMVVPGENETALLKNLSQLHDDLVVWFNAKRCSVPVQYLTSALQRFTKSLGWSVESKGPACLELKRQDGRKTTCFVYSRYDDNFAAILEATRLTGANGSLVVYGYGGDLTHFRSRLTETGWKPEKNNHWSKGNEKLNFSFAVTDDSLNVFLRGVWPEHK